MKGLINFKSLLDEANANIRTRVEDVCAASAEQVRSQVVVDINTQKPNPDYVVPANATGRRRHIPAPPGGPPNSDTGRLSASYTTELIRGPRIVARVVAGTIYAKWLEFGTRRMAARPHLLPRFQERVPVHIARLREALRAGIKR